MNNKLMKIQDLKEILAGKRPLNAGEIKRLRDEFMINNTYNSNAIEGNTLTLRETALILNEGVTISEKPIKEHLEVIGHRDAFEYITKLVSEKVPLSEKEIKEIHSLVLMNDRENRGVYRKLPVQILGSKHIPPQPYMVEKLMEDLLINYNNRINDSNIIEIVAGFHLRFEGIHPFIDGNGRTGRLIMNFELMKAGLLPINVKYSDRNKYYDCFDEYKSTQNANGFVDLIANYEIEELEKYIEMLN